jgi:hypothetical protein
MQGAGEADVRMRTLVDNASGPYEGEPRELSQLLWESVAALCGRKDNEPITKKQRRHSPEQIIRCLKRKVAREIYPVLLADLATTCPRSSGWSDPRHNQTAIGRVLLQNRRPRSMKRDVP